MDTTVKMTKEDCLKVVERMVAKPELRDDIFRIVNQVSEVEYNLNNFTTNLLLLTEEYGTETERKTIHKMVKRLKAKYGGISND